MIYIFLGLIVGICIGFPLILLKEFIAGKLEDKDV